MRDQIDTGWSVLQMAGGMADEFEDQTGIASLGGATYDATGDYLHNPGGGYGSNFLTGGTASASGEAGGAAANAVDGNTGTQWMDPSDVVGWWKYDLGAGVAKAPIKLRLMPGSNSGTSRLNGWTLKGSNDGTNWTIITSGNCTNSISWQEFTFANTTAYRYLFVDVTSTHGGNAPGIMEVEMMEALVPTDVTVVSSAFTASAQPAEARLVLLHQPVSAVTPNTDLIAEASRDGGTTWSAVTLVNEGAFDATTNILSGLADLAAQPAGTSMKWRLRTLNTKEQRLHGIWMQWR